MTESRSHFSSIFLDKDIRLFYIFVQHCLESLKIRGQLRLKVKDLKTSFEKETEYGFDQQGLIWCVFRLWENIRKNVPYQPLLIKPVLKVKS